MSPQVNEKVLDEALAGLETAKAWSPRVISKLESHIRAADEAALFRINPFNFAREKNISESETIDLLLHATALGLFEMDWLLVCPMCSCVVESFQTLKGVNRHYHCYICQADFEAKLDQYIMVSFTVSASARDIRFCHPDLLSPREIFFEYHGTRDGLLPDGTAFVDVQIAALKEVSHLPPGESTRISVDAEEGIILGVSPQGRAAILYSIAGARNEEPRHFRLTFGDKVRKHAGQTTAPGPLVFDIRNITGERGTFAVFQLPPGYPVGHAPITFVPFLTGKRLLTTQTFRDLFRSEVIRASEGIGISDIALLFTDLKGSTALYDRIGDLNAFALVQQHFDRLQDVTVRHNGAIIKTIGDAVMAAFLQPADAVRAALAMREDIASFNQGQPSKELVLKIGIHNGAAIAVTQNDRLDYFGQTVNIAARVQDLAEADEIYLSQDVFEADMVQAELAHLRVEPLLAKLKGINEDLRVFRIPALTPDKAAPPRSPVVV